MNSFREYFASLISEPTLRLHSCVLQARASSVLTSKARDPTPSNEAFLSPYKFYKSSPLSLSPPPVIYRLFRSGPRYFLVPFTVFSLTVLSPFCRVSLFLDFSLLEFSRCYHLSVHPSCPHFLSHFQNCFSQRTTPKPTRRFRLGRGR